MNDKHHQADIARYFQAQYSDFDQDISFYRELARQANGSILELGCGTGRVLLPLAAEGYVSVGIDHDPAMLHRFKTQIESSAELDLHLIQAELLRLPLAKRFKLALAPCSTMSFLDDRQFSAALSQVHRVLAADGQLVMDIPSPKAGAIDDNEGEIIEHFHEPERGTEIQLSAAEREPRPNVHQVDWHYDEMHPDGTTHRRTVTVNYHLRDLEEIHRYLKKAGFAFEAAYGDYQLSEYRPGSPGLIVIARR